MKLTTLMLADHASVRENLLFVTGGGVNRVTASGFPIPFTAFLAMTVTFDNGEGEGRHEFQLDFRRRGARTSTGGGSGGFTVTPPDDRDASVPMHSSLAADLRPFQIPGPGTYVVTVTVDGRRMGRIPVLARLSSAEPGEGSG